MNEILQLPSIRNEKCWYLLSLFYAREKWANLINEIKYFHQEWKNQFSNCLISFSGEKGEHLQVVFVAHHSDSSNYTDEIQLHFQSFFEQNPSISSIPFPYGKAVWGNYPNNSLTWNKFKLPDYSDQYIDFHQKTMDVTLTLLTGDFSADSFFSVGMYLIIKCLCCIDHNKQKNALNQALYETSISSPHFVYTVKELTKEIDIHEVGEVIESYRNEDANNYSPELIKWLNEVKNIMQRYSFETLCTFFCKIVGLSGLRQLMILELLNIWYNRIM